MSDFNIDEVVSDVATNVRSLLDSNQPKLKAFIRSQARGSVEYAAEIAEHLVNGNIQESEAKVYLDKLEEMVTASAYVIIGSTVALFEAVWNAIVNTIWNALEAVLTGVLNAALPIPDINVDD
ncbi:hypothetical protein [Vibrio crassostreae]|uniref:hypothetical protein n=1 Tax=Vibrio crassostreae TaxID=246167 RepID=UPI00352F6451